jgi:hypothetical protein
MSDQDWRLEFRRNDRKTQRVPERLGVVFKHGQSQLPVSMSMVAFTAYITSVAAKRCRKRSCQDLEDSSRREMEHPAADQVAAHVQHNDTKSNNARDDDQKSWTLSVIVPKQESIP